MMQLPSPDSTRAQLMAATELARAGNQQAFEYLFEYYHGPVCTYLAYLVRNDEVGRDLTQETFVRAWKGLPKLREDMSFRTWLYSVATATAKPYFQPGRLTRRPPSGNNARDTASEALNVAGSEEQPGGQNYLIRVLAALSPQSRSCLLLQHIADFPQSEVATILGISEKDANTYVSRGSEQIRLALAGQQSREVSLTPCPFWAEKLAAMHPDDLSAFEYAALETHLASCSTCTTIYAEYAAIAQSLSQLPAVETPPGLPSRLLELWQARGGSTASTQASGGDAGAEHVFTSRSPVSQPVPTLHFRHKERRRKLTLALVSVLVVAIILGSFLVFLTTHRAGTAGATRSSPLIAWKIVSSPNQGSAQNSLDGIAAVSANDVWAVGYSSSSNVVIANRQALIEHWDGTQWSVVREPAVKANSSALRAIAAVSSNDIWTVGNSFNSRTNISRTLIEHWDGAKWSVVSSPDTGGNGVFLAAIAVVSANNIWAVGGSYHNVTNVEITGQTLIEHWNGKQWSIIQSPNPGPGLNGLYGVAAVSADDIWAVGSVNNNAASSGQILIEHWDGSQWSIVGSPSPGAGFNVLDGVAVVSARDVWAVGSNTNDQVDHTLIEHWNGTQWSIVKSPNPGIGGNLLSMVSAVSAGDVWAVGSSPLSKYPGQVSQTLIEHWDGTQWGAVASPNSGSNSNSLSAVTQVPHSGKIWAVGSVQANGPAALVSPRTYIETVTSQTIIESCCS